MPSPNTKYSAETFATRQRYSILGLTLSSQERTV